MYQISNSIINKKETVGEDNSNLPQFANITDASLFDDNNDDISKQPINSIITKSNIVLDKKIISDDKASPIESNSAENSPGPNFDENIEGNQSNIKLNEILNCNNVTVDSTTGRQSFDTTDEKPVASSLCNSNCDNKIDGANLNEGEDSRDGIVDFEETSGDEDDGSMDTDDDSQFSNLSGLSDMSGQDWKPMAKPLNWVQRQIHSGTNPRDILSQLLSTDTPISEDLNDMTLWRILASMLSEPPRREKLGTVNTLTDVVQLFRQAKNVIVLTGAGVSVSCGIPDFRSSDGIYSRLAKDFPDLPDPQAMFDINYFSKDPRPFYKFAREIYPGQFIPSACHRFIKLLEKKGKLLRNYTQNIDTLEQVAGIRNVIECHGSFATASCTKCKFKQTADDIREDVFAQRIPLCLKCQPNRENISIDAKIQTTFSQIALTDGVTTTEKINFRELVQNGIMKPDIVFFGEGLPDAFHSAMSNDKDKCDLLIVIGSSLKVRPVALIPNSIPADVPQILINREKLNHLEFDVELLGDSDIIINQLCHMLGEEWSDVCWKEDFLTESVQLKSPAIEIMSFPSPPANNRIPADLDSDIKKYTTKKETVTSSSSSFIGYCDSGFESSSSSSIANTRLSSVSPSSSSLSPPSYCEDFHKQKLLNSRHLSVDSSKDSGCDSSSNSVSALSAYEEQRTNNFCLSRDNRNQNLIKHQNKVNTNTASSTMPWAPKPSTLKNPQCAGERLYDNTYYYHSKSCSYVFPGGQVCFNSESEDENDDIEKNLKEIEIDITNKNNVQNDKEIHLRNSPILGKRSLEQNNLIDTTDENIDLQPPAHKKR